MSAKTTKTLYWVLLAVFCLFHVFDAIGGLTMAQAGIDAMRKMELPAYLMPFLAVLKLLGVIALLQNKFQRIKEWAFAGFAFSLMGATVAHVYVNDPAIFIVMPVIFLAMLFVIYYCRQKLITTQEKMALA